MISNSLNQINIAGGAANTADQYEQLFKAYEDFQKDTTRPQKNAMNFWGYINKGDSGFTLDGIVNTFDQLGDKANMEAVKDTLKAEKDKADQNKAEQLRQDTEKSRQIEGEKADRMIGIMKLQAALEDFKKDPKYAKTQGQSFFINFLKERKVQANDTSETYYGFTSDEILLNSDGEMEKPTVESIKEEEIPVVENNVDTTDAADEKPEESTLTITKERLLQSIKRYIDKFKALKNSTGKEKEQLTKDLEQTKKDLDAEKERYETAKNYFLGTMNYDFQKFTKEDYGKVPTKIMRYITRENKLFNAPKITTMKTYRRNMTLKKLIKKFNKIGDKPENGVNFIMGFEKARLLRYTGIKITTGLSKIASSIGIETPAKEFHTFFNAGKANIFAILDADTGDKKTNGEIEVINALKARINYYGYAYARKRATERVNPFLDAEQKANADGKIIQMTKPMAA